MSHHLRQIVVAVLFAALPLTARAVTLAPAAEGYNYIVLDTPSSNPFASATLVNSLNSAAYDVTGLSNISRLPYTQATVSLTTDVYRLSNGSLGFAYTLHSQFFPDTLDPLSFAQVMLPSFSVAQFGDGPLDINASIIPGVGGPGINPPAFTVFRNSVVLDTLTFSFVNDRVPSQLPAFYSVHAGSPPSLTLYVQTPATVFGPEDALLVVSQRDARAVSSPGFLTNVSLASLAPATPPLPGLPEPLSVLTLPLALAALHLRLRRRT